MEYSFDLDEKTSEETKNFWTKEKYESAKPIDLRILSEEEFQQFSKDQIKVSDHGEIDSSSSQLLSNFGDVSTANYTKYPYSYCGAIFGSNSWSSYQWGTATFVTDQILLTAAHCVVDEDGKLFDNLQFVQGYDYPSWFQSTFYPKKVLVSKKYIDPYGPNRAWLDYAFILTTKKSSGNWWVQFKQGDYDDHTEWTSVGYPKNYGGGRTMKKVNGHKGTEYNHSLAMKQNPMTHGASGGPWLAYKSDKDKGPTSNPHIIGLNAFIEESHPDVMYGPKFTREFWDLYEEISS